MLAKPANLCLGLHSFSAFRASLHGAYGGFFGQDDYVDESDRKQQPTVNEPVNAASTFAVCNDCDNRTADDESYQNIPY